MKIVVNVVYGVVPALLMMCSAFSMAQEIRGDEAAVALTRLLEKTRTLRAEVLQLTLDQQGREVQEFHATLTLAKPDHFRFHATQPYERLMVTDGVKLWNYEPDLEQVTIDPFSAEYSRTPGMLLSADADTLATLFDISMLQIGDRGQRFTLLPLEPEALLASLSLGFDEGELHELQFEDSLGQRTSMSFDKVESNPVLAEDIFTFQIPDGIDVIDSTVD